MAKTASEKRFLLTIEVLAILTGVLYTVLYIKAHKECFYFAGISATLYTYLCYKQKIFAETFLQFFYILFALYGWLNWGESYTETSYPLSYHLSSIFISVVLVILTGFLLKKYSQTKLPFLDSYTTIFSLTATWFMIHFVHENWIYWMAIDSVSIYLYYKRDLRLSTLLYAFYFYLALAGYFRWELPF